jgi:hypothetical protein
VRLWLNTAKVEWEVAIKEVIRAAKAWSPSVNQLTYQWAKSYKKWTSKARGTYTGW